MSSPVATNALTFNGFVTAITTLAVAQTKVVSGVILPADQPFQNALPSILNYAELRIQRDLDLLALQSSNNYTLTAGSNFLSISPNDFITVQTVSVTVNGVPTPLTPVTKEWLRNVYGDPTYLSAPAYFAMHGGDFATAGTTSLMIEVGPYPDQNYATTLTGTIRMPTLYYSSALGAENDLTWISTWLPDLLVYAALIYISAYQRDFSLTSNDPQMGTNYENQYQTLLKGALVEEARRRFQAGGWTASAPALVASPSR